MTRSAPAHADRSRAVPCAQAAEAYGSAFYQFSETQAALAATAYEYLGAVVREHSPDIAHIELERPDPGRRK